MRALNLRYFSAASNNGVKAGCLLLTQRLETIDHESGLLTKNPIMPISARNTHSVVMLKVTIHTERAGVGFSSVPNGLSTLGSLVEALNTIGSRAQARNSEHSSDSREESHWINTLESKDAPATLVAGSNFHIVQCGFWDGLVNDRVVWRNKLLLVLCSKLALKASVSLCKRAAGIT